ncbi:MAG: AEC family transporter [Coleofasciculus sp. S288]|nr:AEC family transporter [Coleofasciculus sp. S288]
MTETLFHAYTPLVVWTGLGLLLFRFVPKALPRLLGRTLYWVGVPLQILALARRTNFSEGMGLALIVTVTALLLGLTLAWISLLLFKQLFNKHLKRDVPVERLSCFQEKSWQGSFILSSILGNTGFVGLAIAPLLVSDRVLNLVVFYSVAQNIIGTYGIGVFIASYFGHQHDEINWWIQIRDVLRVPSLWAFIFGILTHSVELPAVLESGLQTSLGLVIASAFLLMGIRLAQIQGWKSFQMALIPSLLKVVVLPSIVGIGTTLIGLPPDARLALVLMSGMPTAFAGIILAEEYDLNRELIASSIVMTVGLLLLIIPLWLVLLD